MQYNFKKKNKKTDKLFGETLLLKFIYDKCLGFFFQIDIRQLSGEGE